MPRSILPHLLYVDPISALRAYFGGFDADMEFADDVDEIGGNIRRIGRRGRLHSDLCLPPACPPLQDVNFFRESLVNQTRCPSFEAPIQS
jgi:hypothetical protein